MRFLLRFSVASTAIEACECLLRLKSLRLPLRLQRSLRLRDGHALAVFNGQLNKKVKQRSEALRLTGQKGLQMTRPYSDIKHQAQELKQEQAEKAQLEARRQAAIDAAAANGEALSSTLNADSVFAERRFLCSAVFGGL